MDTLNFDGCGINLGGRRILSAPFTEWDTPEFQQLCQLMITAPDLLAALRGLLEAMETPRSLKATAAWDAARVAIAKAESKE